MTPARPERGGEAAESKDGSANEPCDSGRASARLALRSGRAVPLRLERAFYERDTLAVARDLLGKRLCRRVGGRTLAARVVEVESYGGQEDLASHARAGPTPRASIMFGRTGVAYVYLVYGMHHCLNVVAHAPDGVGAVLVRAVAPEGELGPTNGPGKLARALSIDRALNGADLVLSEDLWLEDAGAAPPRIVAGPRIGVDYAGPVWAAKPWRLHCDGDPHVSRVSRPGRGPRGASSRASPPRGRRR